ncbi:hypothetical protein OHA25_60445 (plasmid) [Nonomuraea sp. NBC_00507]|uniref:hypothetical protein n=1 Tax=Nonomuraea sp. NBC_00507 TaxID=2976002 RepID=UPI002E19C204
MDRLAAHITIDRMSGTLVLLELARLARQAPPEHQAAIEQRLQIEITLGAEMPKITTVVSKCGGPPPSRTTCSADRKGSPAR